MERFRCPSFLTDCSHVSKEGRLGAVPSVVLGEGMMVVREARDSVSRSIAQVGKYGSSVATCKLRASALQVLAEFGKASRGGGSK